MNKKTVRAGIVGAGFSASFHFEAIEQVYGANVYVCKHPINALPIALIAASNGRIRASHGEVGARPGMRP